jgi:hypothetical protein
MEVKGSLAGIGSSVEVFEDRIEIKPKGALGFAGGKGNETIFIKDISSV